MNSPLTILVAGGTGFIGQALINDQLKRGNKIIVLGRNQHKIKHYFAETVTTLTWPALNQEAIKQCDLIINLAGENIGDKRWTPKRKQAILESRINTTEKLAHLCANLGDNAPSLFNASAIGIYPLQEINSPSLDKRVDEKTPIESTKFTGFLNEIGIKWEQATQVAKQKNIRVVNLRFGVVLSPKGGMLKKLFPLFRIGLGQKISNGRQILSWISLQDLLQIIQFLIEHDEINGPINLVSPESINQQRFANLFATYLHRPRWLCLPKFFVKFLFGQMGKELLLQGQNVYPTKLLKYHYSFSTPTLKSFFAKTG